MALGTVALILSEIGSLEGFARGVTRSYLTFRRIALGYYLCNNPDERYLKVDKGGSSRDGEKCSGSV